MMIRKISLILLISLFISGCTSEQEIITKEKIKTPEIIHPNPPSSLKLNDLEWKVLNKEKIKTLLENSENKQISIIALTPEGYKNLSLNIQEFKRYILQQREIIMFYKNVFKKFKQN